MVKLSDNFLNKYKNIKSPMTDLGNFVYYRTYSRFIESEQRREYWWETVKRVVEYNCNLVDGVTEEEAEKLFDNIFNLRQFPSGRSLWVGGTKSSKKFPMSNFNCSFTTIESIDDICDVFYLMLLGTGVGFRIFPEDVERLPDINKNIKIEHIPYSELKNKSTNTLPVYYKDSCEIFIGDSKEGWVEALRLFLNIITDTSESTPYTIKINYNNIRKKGEILKTFGGTASGYESMQIMFDRIFEISQNTGTKFSTIDCLDVCNLVGNNVLTGGVRRVAGIGLFDVDDEAIRYAKNAIYYQDNNGDWQTNEKLLHRTNSNNSIIFTKKPSKEKLKEIFKSIKISGEPAFVNGQTALKRFPEFKGVNPCFTGDMKLLTSEGYKRLDSLEGIDFNIVSRSGKVSKGKVWCSGEKPIFEIKRRGLDSITCTENHIFMLNDGSKCEAKDLKGKRLMPFLDSEYKQNDLFIKLGFLQGDGCLTRLNSEEHLGLEVNIGEKDDDILPIFNLIKKHNKRSYYVGGYNNILRELCFSSNSLPERIFPKTYNSWDDNKKLGFLKGCYSANGSVLSVGRVTYKTTCRQFAEELKQALSEFEISAYITTNRHKNVKFSNGEYLCKESYDVNIQQYKSRLNFFNAIGFIQKYKTEKLRKNLIEKSPIVDRVQNTNLIKKVYDFTESTEHWGVIEGFIAHNCVEILLPNKGLCNLTTINMMSVLNEDNSINLDRLDELCYLGSRISYRMACVELELKNWDKVQKEHMLLGCSLTGWQDFVNATNINEKQQSKILNRMKLIIKESAKSYSQELGFNEPSMTTCLKPEGTLSLLPTVSAGLHFSHSPYYIRRVRVSANDPIVKVCEELGWNMNDEGYNKVIDFPCKSPEGKTKYNVSAIEQLEIYRMFMDEYVDMNASNTITVRSYEWDNVVDWIYSNWDTFVGVSFLSLDDTFYPLAPYEKITEEQYNNMIKDRKEFDPELLNKYIKQESKDEDLGSDCAGGACPIR